MKKIFLIIVLLFTSLIGVKQNITSAQTIGSEQLAPSQLAIIGANRAVGSDQLYGYSWDDSSDFQTFFVNTENGTTIFDDQSVTDEAFAGPYSLGFSFEFYENEYTEIYVSDNGIISFGNGTKAALNKTIPFDPAPNDFIALYWDDLIVGQVPDSTVKYETGFDVNLGKNYFAVGYRNVSRDGQSDSLNFEAVLYDDGDICLNYDDVDPSIDTMTIGIEDGDGVDGALYSYNQPSVDDGVSICFTRPADTTAGGAKAFPAYQGGFTESSVISFTFQIRNTSAYQNYFNLYTTPINTPVGNWSVTFYDENDVLLTDSDSDASGYVDTGIGSLFAAGETRTYQAEFLTDAPNSIADYALFDVIVQSEQPGLNANESTIAMQASVATPHALIFNDNNLGSMHIDKIQPDSVTRLTVPNVLIGPVVFMSADILPNGNFFYIWDFSYTLDPDTDPKLYIDMQYAILDSNGVNVVPKTTLVDNSTQPDRTRDQAMKIAVADNGNVGIIWRRTVIDAQGDSNTNIYFAILSQNGAFIKTPTNITGNSTFSNTADYVNFGIAATDNNNFILSWVDKNERTTPKDDLEIVVFNSFGGIVTSLTELYIGSPGGNTIEAPAVHRYFGDQVLLSYTYNNELRYEVLNSNGGQVTGMLSTGVDGAGQDGILINNSAFLLAWENTTTLKIQYAIIASNNSLGTVQTLNTPDGRDPTALSITAYNQANGILSWLDKDEKKYMYYALIDASGNIVVPAQIAKTGELDTSNIFPSLTGQGIMPLTYPYAIDTIYRVFLPLTLK